MAVTNYFTVSGGIIGESTNGVRLNYLTDALGSVTATVDQTGTVQNTYRYKPYGALLAKTGTAPDPMFRWVGTEGYRHANLAYCSSYVRARTDDNYTGRWLTIETNGFGGLSYNMYTYARNSPTSLVAPSGLVTCPRTPRAACYSCWYTYYLVTGSDPLQACTSVNTRCGGSGPGISCDNPVHNPGLPLPFPTTDPVNWITWQDNCAPFKHIPKTNKNKDWPCETSAYCSGCALEFLCTCYADPNAGSAISCSETQCANCKSSIEEKVSLCPDTCAYCWDLVTHNPAALPTMGN